MKKNMVKQDKGKNSLPFTSNRYCSLQLYCQKWKLYLWKLL